MNLKCYFKTKVNCFISSQLLRTGGRPLIKRLLLSNSQSRSQARLSINYTVYAQFSNNETYALKIYIFLVLVCFENLLAHF